MSITYRGKFGERTVTGRVERLDGSGWLRFDVWAPSDGRAPFVETCHVDRRGDLSDVRSTYPEGGDSLRCGWCYLGASHSDESHLDRVAAFGEKMAHGGTGPTF